MDRATIERWLAEFDAIPPLNMTAEEEAAWQAARQVQRNYELSHAEEEHQKLMKLFP